MCHSAGTRGSVVRRAKVRCPLTSTGRFNWRIASSPTARSWLMRDNTKPEARNRLRSICRRNPGYAIAWRIDQRAAQAQSPPEPSPLLNPQATMQLEFHQLDRRWENLRVHQPHRRQGRLITALAESGQQTPIVVVAAW